MINFIKSLFGGKPTRYVNHSEAVLITCFYNPKNSQARLDAFNKFYHSIMHLNHRIIECVMPGRRPQLPNHPNITRITTESNLWHKEQLLNRIVADLPTQYKYVFWVDADVLFTNMNWMADGVKQLQDGKELVQLFEYCFHMEKGESVPSEAVLAQRYDVHDNRRFDKIVPRRAWRGYAANYVHMNGNYNSQNYDVRGHVGFAWGARRAVLRAVPLFDRALIGGADGIIAYAGTGQLEQVDNIKDMFAPMLQEVYAWGRRWNGVVQGRVGYVKGDLYHIWHGAITDRQYYKRIKDFAPANARITTRDKSGLYVADSPRARQYVDDYYTRREVADDGFATSMALGYATNDGLLGGVMGGNLMGGMVGDALNTTEDQPSYADVVREYPSDSLPTTQPTRPSEDVPATQPSSYDVESSNDVESSVDATDSQNYS
jgi:hypothetical protein